MRRRGWIPWLFCMGACGAPGSEPNLRAPVVVEASPEIPRSELSPLGRACLPMHEARREVDQALVGQELLDQAESLAPALLALADDLGERHVAEAALDTWRDAFRVLVYRMALAARVAAAAVSDEAARAATAAWFERLGGEAERLGGLLEAACQGDPGFALEPSIDALTGTAFVLNETDEAYRLHRVAEVMQAVLDGYPHSEQRALLDRIAARVGRVHASTAEVAAYRRAIIEVVKAEQRVLDAPDELAGWRAVQRLITVELRSLWGVAPAYLLRAEETRCESGHDRSCIRVALHHHATGDLSAAKARAEKGCGPAALHACALASAIAFREGDDALRRRAFAEHDALCREGLGGACAVVAHQLDEGRLVPPDPSRARALRLRLCEEIGGEASCAALASGDQDERTRKAWARACDSFGTWSACEALGREGF